MKRFLLFALCATVALAGCQKIDEPVITPEQSSFKVSAVIDDNSTKVTYEVTDDAVTPTWAEGDRILVYDGTTTAELTVESVGTDGVASFADGYTPTEGATTLHAVYYPGKATEDFADGEMKVDLTNQNGAIDGTTPAIMCATATVSGDEVRFRFYNQTAIIGLKKFQVSPNEEIKYLSIKGLIAKGTIKVVNGTLSLVPSTEKMDITVNFDPAISADGNGMYSNPIYFMALPTEDAQIGVAASSATFTHCNTTAINVTDIEAGQYYYLSKKLDADDAHVARYSNDGGANWTYTGSLAAAIDGIATTTAKADGKVELLKDITIESQVKISGKKFTWNGNGHTVSFISKYSEITDNKQGGIHIMTSSDVDFTDTKFVGPGTSETATDRPFAVVASTASFGKDVTISDFKNSRPYGGAIWCNNQSIVYLKDNLKITNCHNAPTSSSYGGGAICSDAAVYVQDDVIISNCSSQFWGGAILSNYNNETSKLIISGNARIENCTSVKGGGAIALFSGTKLTLEDNVLIKDCTSSAAGGGICNNQTTKGYSIEIKGNVHITGCKANGGDGGGIRDNCTYSSMTVSDNALIDSCSCTGKGGGLYQAGTYTIKGNVRIENCSATNGGGIAVWKNATLDDNVLIKKCEASANGGGVYVTYNSTSTSFGQLAIKGSAKIEDCKAANGGGICADSISVIAVKMTGGTIKSCSAENGGAVYCPAGTINLSGAEISECTASTAGGSFYIKGGTVNITDNSVITGANAQVTTAGTLNIDNSTYTYTGTDYALKVVGTGSTSTGLINVTNGSSVKATAGSGTSAKYGTINVTDSEIIAAGSYCSYINTGGKGTFTNAYAVNTNGSGGYVFYSGTGNNASLITVNSGYFAGNNITGWYATSGTNNRIYIAGGYYSNNAFNAKTQYSSVTVQSVTPVTKEIGGVSYSFPYQAM